MESGSFWQREFEQRENASTAVWLEEPSLEIEEVPSEDMISLLNLGKLTHEIEIRGHRIVLKTLKMSEELEISLFIKPYIGTLEEGRALATAVVACSIESYDGNPLVTEIGPDENLLRKKFDLVRNKMYWPVIQMIYEEGYIPLLEKQAQAIEEFRKK